MKPVAMKQKKGFIMDNIENRKVFDIEEEEYLKASQEITIHKNLW